jgi:FkbM family methyltransferase
MFTKTIKALLPKKTKTWAKEIINNASGTAEIQQSISAVSNTILETAQRLNTLEHKVSQIHGNNDHEPNLKINSCNYIVAPWWETNFWEPSVQLALRDLIKPGSIVFDVGANLAGLSILMSRLTGPKGIVCAFEASPRIIELTHGNIIASGCNNIQLYHNAIFSESGKDLMIYAGGHLNDSIYNQGEFQNNVGKMVKTMSLDDFVNHTGLIPDVIKMDIEGAEFDALQGMQTKVLISKPHLILETSPNDMRCFDFLLSLGYISLDLGNYKPITSANDFPKGSEIRNLLYVHETRIQEIAYTREPQLAEQLRLNKEDFINQSGSWYSGWVSLKPGRYVVLHDLSGNPDDEVMVGIEDEQKEMCRYHANRGFLQIHYPDMPFHITNEKKCRLFLKLLKSNSETHCPPVSVTLFKMTDILSERISPINYLVA